jgi:hypothetical protein
MANQNIPAIQQKAGNIGIGTSDPGSYKLNVNGESAFQDHVTVNSAKYIYTNNIGANSTSTNLVIAGPSSAHTVFTVANVGIGSTSPAYKLDVNGVTRFQDIVRFKVNAWNLSDDSFNRFYFAGSGRTYFGSGNGYEWRSDADAALMVLLNGGSLGIGTTSPVAALDVRGTMRNEVSSNPSNAILFQLTNQTTSSPNGCKIAFDVYNVGAAAIGMPSNSADLVFYANGSSTERMRITSGGNVGIGTTSPSATLSVQGNTNLGDSYGNTTSSTYTTRISGHAMRYDASNRYGNYGVLILNSDNGWTSGARRYMLTNGLNTTKFAIIRSTDATTDPSFGDAGAISSGTADFVINNAGNVGIGTTDPAQKIHIDTSTGTLAARDNGDGALWSTLSSSKTIGLSSGDNYAQGSNYTWMKLTGGSSGNMIFAVINEAMRITNTGNVGIGTTSPSYKLHVAGDINTTGDIYFNSTSTLRATRRYVSTVNLDNSGYTVICNVSGDALASAVRITIQGTANSVVINTTADILVNHFQDILISSQSGIYTTLTLRVISNGNEAFSIAATTNSANTCTCNIEVYPLNSESVSFGGSAQAGSTLTHTCRPGINISATGGNDGDFAASGYGYFGGNLGIGGGSYSPGNKLLISSTVGAAGFDNGISIITQPGTYTSGHGGMIQFQNEDVITAGIRGVRESGWGSGMAFYVHNPSSGNTFNSTFVERMRINENGNVGIGTTSPAYALDVTGTIRATGDVIAFSDARVKENIETITDALTKVTSLRGVSYTRKDNEDKSRKVGVIAQEVLPILPEVVQKDTNGNYSVAYGNIVGVLVEAIKELKAEIDILKNK